jgi:hypothetical protein
VHEMEGRDKEARRAYKDAVALDAGHARALNNMASMSMAQVENVTRDCNPSHACTPLENHDTLNSVS